MGGYGSGRRRIEVKQTTSEYLQLDVRAMNRQGALKPGRFFQWAWSRNGQVVASLPVLADHDRLVLETTGSSGAAPSEKGEYAVAIQWTPCHYGGSRPWFICPAKDCGRRVAILYSG